MSDLTPLYVAAELQSAFELRYAWTGWPSHGPMCNQITTEFLHSITSAWHADGLRLLESHVTPDQIQLTVSVTPQTTPVFVAARLKGRLQHAFRCANSSMGFSRKIALRSIGHNRRVQVEAYIRDQTAKEPFADERFREFLQQFTVRDAAVDLASPSCTNSGRYWCNLHLVLVVAGRREFVDAASLTTIRDTCLAVAAKKHHRVASLAVMPDHVHIALRTAVDQSPEEIALSYLNNLGYRLGQNKVWQASYYAGTFGEYDMDAVRRSATS